jgi:protocatechuate 3,4-dioxygenase alpha subunit
VKPTPSQTIGPFFRPGLEWLAVASPPGGIPVRGQVLDGTGDPVADAVVEVWQPGRFVRALTDDDGTYAASVVAPGPADVSVFARGLLQRVVTRLYLPDEEGDEVLALVEPARRTTLVATRDGGGLRFDIRLQGPEETVFFAW